MSIFTKIAVAAGMTTLRRGSVPPAGMTGSGHPQGASPYGRFQGIADALREALARLAQEEFRDYHAFAPDLFCQVKRIEIRPMDAAGEEALNALLARINQPSVIADFIRRELLKDLPMGRYLDFNRFEAFVPLPVAPVAGPAAGGAQQSDAASLEDAQLLREFDGAPAQPVIIGPGYEVTFQWDEVREPASAAPDADVWQLEDGQGARPLRLARRGAQAKWILGSGEDVDVRLDGRFTSGRHAALWFDRGTWWYEDLRSSNGSRVIRRGREDHVFPPRAAGAAAVAAVEVGPDCAIFLAAQSDGPRSDVPKLVWGSGGTRTAPATPVAPVNRAPAADEGGTGTGTGLRLALDRQPDASLQVDDGDGSRRLPLYALTLPFHIGRALDADCCVPALHASVSAQHLEIHAIEANGVLVRIVGSNGAVLDGVQLPQDSRTLWRWGQTLAIGEPRQPCRLTILPPGMGP
ncbi:MAG: FHA domain-containing protein [Pseudomonadota bacterium]